MDSNIKSQIIDKFRIFKDNNFSKKFIEELSNNIIEENYLPK